MRSPYLLRSIAVLAMATLFAAEAYAFRLSPMRYILAPGGPEAEITLRLENTYSLDLPIEVEVFRRTITEDGEEIREPAEDDFLIFPPQSLIPPGSEQAFRVRYIGPPALSAMESYVVMFRQLPIRNRPEGSSGIDFMMALGTAAYVSPDNATASLALSVEATPEDNGTVVVWVTNSGNAYGYIDQFDIRLQSGNAESVIIPASQISGSLQTPLIMPNARRRLVLDVPPEAAGQTWITADISTPSTE